MLHRRALERWGDDEAYQKYRENTPTFSPIHEKIIEVDAFLVTCERLESQRCSRDERLMMPSNVCRFNESEPCRLGSQWEP